MKSCACLRNRDHKLLVKKGTKRIEQVLEIDKFINLQMQFEVLLKILLTKTEQYLIRNQRKFVLDSRSESEESEKINKINDLEL